MNNRSDKTAANKGSEGRWRPSLRQIGWVIVVVVAALFIVLNNKEAEINLIVASPRWPMWTLVVASMVLGFVSAKLTRGRRRED